MITYSWEYFKERGNYNELSTYYDAGTELYKLDIIDNCGSIMNDPIRLSLVYLYHPEKYRR